jgi:hypothetical protein
MLKLARRVPCQRLFVRKVGADESLSGATGKPRQSIH